MPTSFTPAAHDTALLALRPTVGAELPNEPDASAGDFLHRTLRPVLKLQNQVLLALVADFVREHHIGFQERSAIEQQRLVAELLGRNVKLRYTIIGSVIGLFTQAEHQFYRQHRSEINRRVLELTTQRVQSQLAELTELLTTAGKG
ncbi:hypothetical protein [Hymenobacter metallicola]|uniref:Glyoxalase n=1 Tax=Hymenobacter metallicola TaxID=2563114 RepID=A0A4Z0QF12_9BACT|nr:hypothetical protein [Hymenobacter metallicola]TGE27302.1 hypothetical protein E5K02_13005 [Hymenobacter metallicola]